MRREVRRGWSGDQADPAGAADRILCEDDCELPGSCGGDPYNAARAWHRGLGAWQDEAGANYETAPPVGTSRGPTVSGSLSISGTEHIHGRWDEVWRRAVPCRSCSGASAPATDHGGVGQLAGVGSERRANSNDVHILQDILNGSPILSQDLNHSLNSNTVLTDFLNHNNIVANVEVVSVALGSGQVFLPRQ